MVCSRRRQDHRIVHSISISIQKRDYDSSKFTSESIVSASEKVLVYRPMYKGKLTDNLDFLRYTIFCQKVASSKPYIKPKVLPSTSDEAMDGRKHKLVKAHEWGWTISDAQIQPKYTDLGYEPDGLLSQTHCNCKTV